MKNPYLNLTFGVFVSVIASSSFIIGFFVGGYSYEYTQEEKIKRIEKSSESLREMAAFQASDSFFDVMRDFKFKIYILTESPEEHTPEFIKETKSDLASQINSLECMLAQVPDLELRNKIQKQINDAKPHLQ